MIVQIGKSQRMMVNPGNSSFFQTVCQIRTAFERRPKICQVAEVAAAVATGPSVVSAAPVSKKTFFSCYEPRFSQGFTNIWDHLGFS